MEQATLIKKKLKRGDIFAIVANLVPVFGVWFLGWSAVDAFIVYALETLIVGVMTVLKMGVATLYKGKDTWYNEGSSAQVNGVFFILFFIVHFGLFALIQTTMFSQSAGINPKGTGLFHFFFHWYDYINEDIAWMLGVFAISYLARSLIPFIRNKEYKTMSMMRLMFQPYGRIFIQQFTVILGSMFLSFGFGKGFILVFAIAKIFFEVYVDFEGIINKQMVDMENKIKKGNT
jgi:Family of unknown function (DUF6498)